MDWKAKGKQDGAKGKPPSTFATYKKECSEYGFKTELPEYAAGHLDGLKLFCDFDSGQKYGRAGNRYSGVCPAELEAEFLRGYKIGQKEYELEERERRVQEQEAQIAAQRAQFSANQCSFDSDCGPTGRCESDSTYIGGQYVSRNICKF